MTPAPPPTAPRVKIIASLGPATATPEAVRALVDAGMDAARLNLSHGTHEWHRDACARVRAAADAAGRAVGVMADLAGPKIRLGVVPRRAGHGSRPAPSSRSRPSRSPGDARGASTTYAGLARDVKPGDTLLVDDGLVRLEALASDGVRVTCRVVEGGEVSDHKGINLPGVRVSAPALTPKDLDDLRFVLALGVDMVALSFVRDASAAAAVRRGHGRAGRRVPVFAKLEKPEAVDAHAATSSPPSTACWWRAATSASRCRSSRCRWCRSARCGWPASTASPSSSPPRCSTPWSATRAPRGPRSRTWPTPCSTAPTRCCSPPRPPSGATRSRWSRRCGASSWRARPSPRGPCRRCPGGATVQQAVARAAAEAARVLGARALVAFTRTGSTVRTLASHREPVPLYAFTSEPCVRSQLSVVWGVETFVVPDVRTTDEMVAAVDRAMLELGRGAAGDLIVLVAGTPPGVAGSTNALRVHRLGTA